MKNKPKRTMSEETKQKIRETAAMKRAMRLNAGQPSANDVFVSRDEINLTLTKETAELLLSMLLRMVKHEKVT